MLHRDKMIKEKPRVLFVVAASSYFMSHRFDLALDAIRAGYDVALATQPTGDFEAQKKRLEQAGITLFLIPFRRSSLNPWRDVNTLRSLFNVIRVYSPDTVHNVALKPILYGTIAAKLFNIPKIVNALGGLGYVFTAISFKARLIRMVIEPLFKFLLKGTHIIVQNQDDESLVQHWVGDSSSIHLLQGAGVDTDHFVPAPTLSSNHVITFVGRMLWSKGVGELVEAATVLKNTHPHVFVRLVGDPDLENPDHISMDVLHNWHKSGVIEYLPAMENIAEIYQTSQIAVLPSYREGLPKSMLEAASCGLPLVTTNTIGCKGLVFCNSDTYKKHGLIQGSNGFLVPIRDSKSLHDALCVLLNDQKLCAFMGEKSRDYAKLYWSKEIINKETIDIYNKKNQI